MAIDLAANLSHQVSVVLPPLLEGKLEGYSSNFNALSESKREGEKSSTTVMPDTITQVLYMCYSLLAMHLYNYYNVTIAIMKTHHLAHFSLLLLSRVNIAITQYPFIIGLI